MKPGVKLAAFALVLGAAFGGGVGLGTAFAPASSGPDRMDHMSQTEMDNMNMTPQTPAPTRVP